MIQHRRTVNKKSHIYKILPESIVDLLKQYTLQFIGFVLFTFTICMALSLWSYSPEDPSLNTSFMGNHSFSDLFSYGLTQNYLQVPGAIGADFLFQALGYASVGFIFVIFFWSLYLLSGRSIRRPIWRFLALLGMVLFLAQTLVLFPNTGTHLLSPTYGGSMGLLLSHLINSLFDSIVPQYTRWVAAGIGIVFSMGLFCYSMGLRLYQWKTLFLALGASFIFLFKAISKVIEWILDPSLLLLRRSIPNSKEVPVKSSSSDHFLEIVSEETGNRKLSVQREFNFEEDCPEFPQNDNEPEEMEVDSYLQKAVGDDCEPIGAEKKKRGLFSSLIPSKPVQSQNPDEYHLPSVDLLDPAIHKNKKTLTSEQLDSLASQLEKVLQEFGVRGEIVGICPGPVVTLYEFRPAAGIKTSRVIGLADDIARSMSAHAARIAVIPGRNVIGIELPNHTRDTVYLRELLTSEEYIGHPAPLSMILGKDIGGSPIIADLAKMPHLLVAGTTGSGKSVSINTMILSILFKLPPDKCKFIMVDPKMLEFSAYDGIPHLLTPVVTDPKKAVVALKWAVREMENRYRAMSKLGVRNIDGFNARLEEARQNGEQLIRRVQTGFDPDTGKPIFENQALDTSPLPYIVVVVDEMADLMLVAGKDIEMTVQRLAQMARAAGIHLIMATQRPSVDVITGTIKANFPTRISFMVTSKIDSRTILGEQGAEQLLGQGDMLYMAGGGRIIRVHGPFIKDIEVERIVQYLKSQGEPTYIESITEDDSDLSVGGAETQPGDALYPQALEVVRREGKASTSFIQRHLQIGYNRAARMIEQMEKEGVVTPANSVGKREVIG